jgi:hypothetical protein
MGPAILLGGFVALSLLILGTTMRQTGRRAGRQPPSFRRALPWILGGMLAVAAVLVAIPRVPPIVIAGLIGYTAVAVAAMWRMASLDRQSRWMTPSRRLARFGISAIALTWLGLVLGLLLGIADLIASAPYGSLGQ